MVHSLSTGSEQFVYPSARKAHTCVVHDGMVYMVGGVNKKHAQEGEVTKDIWIFDLETKKWLTFEKVWCGSTLPSIFPGIFQVSWKSSGLFDIHIFTLYNFLSSPLLSPFH